jgi:asparagine synthase (glutamine-hydrolysing)
LAIDIDTDNVPSNVEVSLSEDFGWRLHSDGAARVWLKGWLSESDLQRITEHLGGTEAPSPTVIGEALQHINGHFALVAHCLNWTLAIVDWVRSIPIGVTKVNGGWIIDDQPNRLRNKAGLDRGDINADAALSIAMAGYTIGKDTLYRGLEVLGPGELMFLRSGEEPTRHRYYTYLPGDIETFDQEQAVSDLAETTLEIMERMLVSLEGRPLLVPLSAGNDSRLIVSAAKHLGYKDVHCFTYGRAGNFEAETSKAIAERLGYSWRFVPITTSSARRFYASDAYQEYLAYADCCTSVPFVQDMLPIQILKQDGYIPPDAVFANGNSGDFISGLHIVAALRDGGGDASPDVRWSRILEALYEKHFALWRVLRTPENRKQILADLACSISAAGGKIGSPETDHGIYECSEFQDRQCKYVITGQRIYEFLGHDWRMPLWDNAYLRFWSKVPLEGKAGQSLYNRMLRRENWGGVWSDIPVNRQNIRPLALVPLRWLAKALHTPLGRARWHQFEQQFFQYWMDPTCHSACASYWEVATNGDGARHAISWLTRQYLDRHGVGFEDVLSKR